MYCNKKLEMTWWYLETDRVDDECLKTAVQARYSWRSTRVTHRSQLPTGNRLMDSDIQYWPFDHTRKQVSYIASKDQVVVCRFCLTQSSTPLVSLRYMDEFQFPWPAEATNTPVRTQNRGKQSAAACFRVACC